MGYPIQGYVSRPLPHRVRILSRLTGHGAALHTHKSLSCCHSAVKEIEVAEADLQTTLQAVDLRSNWWISYPETQGCLMARSEQTGFRNPLFFPKTSGYNTDYLLPKIR